MLLEFCLLPPCLDGELIHRMAALSEKERLRKAERLPPQKRASSLAAGLLARHALLKMGMPKEGMLLCSDADGRPCCRESGLFLSLSHSGRFCACAVGRSPVGVDVQKLPDVGEAVMRRVCTKREAAWLSRGKNPQRDFGRLWTLKESFLKAAGREAAYPFSKAEFEISADGGVTGPPGYSFTLYELLDGEYLAALCVSLAGGETQPAPEGPEQGGRAALR